MNKSEQELSEDTARYIEFIHLYQQLSAWGQFRANLSIARSLTRQAIQERSWARLVLVASFIWQTVWLFGQPWALPVGLSLAALLAWAAAVATGAGSLWLAAAALSGAAILKRPQAVPA